MRSRPLVVVDLYKAVSWKDSPKQNRAGLK